MNKAEQCQADIDAARRVVDSVNVHIEASGIDAYGRWVAIRLSDGGSDGILYDKKADAMRYQLHEDQCAYVCIPPGGMEAGDALQWLLASRKLIQNGHPTLKARMMDPDSHVVFREPIIRRL